MAKHLKEFDEVPQEALDALYSHRLIEDYQMDPEDYFEKYEFVVDGEDGYVREGSMARAKMWMKGEGSFVARIPDAVILNGKVIKNRYGYSGF